MPFSRRSSQPRDCTLTSPANSGSLRLATRETQIPQPQRKEGFSVLSSCLYLHTMSFVLQGALQKWSVSPTFYSQLKRVLRILQAAGRNVLVLSSCLYSSAAAAAKLLQLCPTLCDPRDGSPPGSPVPGMLHARTLEWVAISFSNA